jgi:hypothetical protein
MLFGLRKQALVLLEALLEFLVVKALEACHSALHSPQFFEGQLNAVLDLAARRAEVVDYFVHHLPIQLD